MLCYCKIAEGSFYMSKYGVMLDLETLGVGDDALIFQIGAVIFHLETGEVCQKFNEHLNLLDMDSGFPKFTDELQALRKIPVMERNIHEFVQKFITENPEVLSLGVEKSTLNFWVSSDSNIDILLEFLNSPNGISEQQLMTNFQEFLLKNLVDKDLVVWGNGISFDVVKIKRKFTKHDLYFPIPFYSERDVRTILDLASMKENVEASDIKMRLEKNPLPHDAYQDCLFQINLVHYCYNLLMNK